MEIKTDSVAELFTSPPPEFFNKKCSGKPNAFATQSIAMFSTYVCDGETAKLKAGEWKVVANISAKTSLTAMDEGK